MPRKVCVAVDDRGRPIAAFWDQLSGMRWLIAEGQSGAVLEGVELIEECNPDAETIPTPEAEANRTQD